MGQAKLGKASPQREGFPAAVESLAGAVCAMDYLEKVLEKLKEWTRRLIEILLGPEAEPEAEPIPIPVEEPNRRRR